MLTLPLLLTKYRGSGAKNDLPSPSIWLQVRFANSSMRYCVFETELRVPAIAAELPLGVTVVISGKFCKLFGPVSTSFVSLGVTPKSPRSIPK